VGTAEYAARTDSPPPHPRQQLRRVHRSGGRAARDPPSREASPQPIQLYFYFLPSNQYREARSQTRCGQSITILNKIVNVTCDPNNAYV
jgi:hypothetical protein